MKGSKSLKIMVSVVALAKADKEKGTFVLPKSITKEKIREKILTDHPDLKFSDNEIKNAFRRFLIEKNMFPVSKVGDVFETSSLKGEVSGKDLLKHYRKKEVTTSDGEDALENLFSDDLKYIDGYRQVLELFPNKRNGRGLTTMDDIDL